MMIGRFTFVLAALAAAACTPAPPPQTDAAPEAGNAARPLQAPSTWTCEDGRALTVAFYGDRVDLTFPDGKKLALPAVMAASGEAYETDGVRFHAKGDEAYLAEGEKTTNCSTQAEQK